MEMLLGPVRMIQKIQGRETWMFWNLPNSLLNGKLSVYQDYELGTTLEVHSGTGINILEAESQGSASLGVVPQGSYVRILGLGVNHPSRVKIIYDFHPRRVGENHMR